MILTSFCLLLEGDSEREREDAIEMDARQFVDVCHFVGDCMNCERTSFAIAKIFIERNKYESVRITLLYKRAMERAVPSRGTVLGKLRSGRAVGAEIDFLFQREGAAKGTNCLRPLKGGSENERGNLTLGILGIQECSLFMTKECEKKKSKNDEILKSSLEQILIIKYRRKIDQRTLRNIDKQIIPCHTLFRMSKCN